MANVMNYFLLYNFKSKGGENVFLYQIKKVLLTLLRNGI